MLGQNTICCHFALFLTITLYHIITHCQIHRIQWQPILCFISLTYELLYVGYSGSLTFHLVLFDVSSFYFFGKVKTVKLIKITLVSDKSPGCNALKSKTAKTFINFVSSTGSPFFFSSCFQNISFIEAGEK